MLGVSAGSYKDKSLLKETTQKTPPTCVPFLQSYSTSAVHVPPKMISVHRKLLLVQFWYLCQLSFFIIGLIMKALELPEPL
jgi:hypothetical protein